MSTEQLDAAVMELRALSLVQFDGSDVWLVSMDDTGVPELAPYIKSAVNWFSTIGYALEIAVHHIQQSGGKGSFEAVEQIKGYLKQNAPGGGPPVLNPDRAAELIQRVSDVCRKSHRVVPKVKGEEPGGTQVDFNDYRAQIGEIRALLQVILEKGV